MATGKATVRKTPKRATRTAASGKVSMRKRDGSKPSPKKIVTLEEVRAGEAAKTTPARDVLGREVKPTKISLKTARGRTLTSALSLPSLKDQQTAAKIVGVDPRLAVHLTKYDVSNILGTRSLTVKSPETRAMYTSILKGREKRGITPRVTATQQAAIARQEAQALREARKPYTPILSKTGEVIPHFDIKRYTDRQAKGVYGPGWYLSVEAVRKAENVNRYANKPITPRTNDIEKKKILGARKLILDQQADKKAASDYFQRIDRGTVKFEVPTKKEITYVKSELKKAIIAELAGTKYTQAQKEAIADTKLNRTPIREDLKRDWANLDNRLSKLLNLPTEREIVAHREKVFGKIPGFAKWQAQLVKNIEASPMRVGFRKYVFGRYNDLREKPLTFGAELAALYVGGEIIGALTKGGTVITRAALVKQASKPTKPLVRAGILAAARQLDNMVKVGYMAPIAAGLIKADWENKFKIGESLFIGGAGYKRGTEYAAKRISPSRTVYAGEPISAKVIIKNRVPGRYLKIADKYIKIVENSIVSKAEVNRFIRDNKAELVIERVRERTIEKVKPERIKSEIEKIKDEVAKNEKEINSKEKLIQAASKASRASTNPSAKSMLKSRATELVREQMEIEIKNEGLRESIKELEKLERIKSEISKGRERARERERVVSIAGERLLREIERAGVERSKKTELERSKEITLERVSAREIERTGERTIEREIEKEIEKTLEVEREIEKEIEKTLEREREKEKEKEKLKELPPILPAWKRREEKKKKDAEQKRIFMEITRIIENQLGDIKSILG